MKNNNIAIVSGGFDPLHVGHIELLNKAREIGSLIVILNNDDFLIRKKGKPFMPFDQRKIILENLQMVDLVIHSLDKDDTVCASLEKLSELRKEVDAELYFCNGGDRTSGENTPEHELCEKLGIKTVYGLGEKIQSSSWLTNEK
jgi:cytidyltransferase-like protein